ncbi:MAG TPA: PAS domain-containing protein, partial [Allosphingosinicella sp.]|nr:PAS domain-containing protein [Allosphingosinicella sp.]
MAKRRPEPDDGAAPLEAEALQAEIARLQEELASARASERMYRSSAELSSRLAWHADADGRMTVMSPIYSTVTGLPLDQALGDGWLDVVPEGEAREDFRRKWLEAVRSGTPFHEEFIVRLANNQGVQYARSEAIPERDPTGRIVGWFGTTQNITEAKQAEDARRAAEERLRESEEMHRYTLELSQQIAWTVEKDGSGLVMSGRYEELTGLADFAQAEESIHPDDRELVQARFRQAIETGQPLNVECRLRMKDGSFRRFRVRARPLRDEDGEVLRWYGVTEDVHDYREADFARQEVEERYRLAGQATRDAIWDHDFVTGTIEWSENAGSVLGAGNVPLGAVTDDWWRERVHPEDRLAVTGSLKAAIEGDARRWTGTYRFRKDDGSYADMVDRGFIIREA